MTSYNIHTYQDDNVMFFSLRQKQTNKNKSGIYKHNTDNFNYTISNNV